MTVSINLQQTQHQLVASTEQSAWPMPCTARNIFNKAVLLRIFCYYIKIQIKFCRINRYYQDITS